MGKLDVSCMRHMNKEEYRVLTAVEMGMRNHHAVPVELVVSIAGLRHGGASRFLNTLLRYKLVHHENTGAHDGYRLTWNGYDVLALRTLTQRGVITTLGRKLGVGKESDVYEAQGPEGQALAIKFHRLGKTSFKAVKAKRDYLAHRRSAGNWLYLSRLAAAREHAFMRALHSHALPTPRPCDVNRHALCMTLVDGFPLYQVRAGQLAGPEAVFRACVHICRRLKAHGLIHCDLNECELVRAPESFGRVSWYVTRRARARAVNLLVNGETGFITVIDFPQMVSIDHPNARDYFERDVNGLVKFFAGKMKYIPDASEVPSFDEADATTGVGEGAVRGDDGSNAASAEGADGASVVRLDQLVRASGFSQQDELQLAARMQMEQRMHAGGAVAEDGDWASSDEDVDKFVSEADVDDGKSPPRPPDVTGETPAVPPPIPVIGEAGETRGDEDGGDLTATEPDATGDTTPADDEEEGEQERAPIGSAWHAFLSGLGNDGAAAPDDDAASELTDTSHLGPGGGMSHANRRKVRAQVMKSMKGAPGRSRNSSKKREKDKIVHQTRPSAL